MTGFSKKRMATTLLPALTAAALLSGCTSSPGEDESPILPTESAEETTPAPGDAEAADIAALERLYGEYWDALIALENGGAVEADPFEGIATPTVIEQILNRVLPIRDSGHRREGEPLIQDVAVTVQGDEARIEACVDEDAWAMVQDGEEVPIEKEGAMPRVAAAERSGGVWLIKDLLPQEKALITCD